MRHLQHALARQAVTMEIILENRQELSDITLNNPVNTVSALPIQLGYISNSYDHSRQ